MLALAIMAEWLPVSVALIISRHYSDAPSLSFQGWGFEILFQTLMLMMAAAVALKNRRLPVKFELAAPQVKIWALQFVTAFGTLVAFSLMAHDDFVAFSTAFLLSFLCGALAVRYLVLPESDICLLASSRLKTLGTWKKVMAERREVAKRHLSDGLPIFLSYGAVAGLMALGIYWLQTEDYLQRSVPLVMYLMAMLFLVNRLSSYTDHHYKIFLRKVGDEDESSPPKNNEAEGEQDGPTPDAGIPDARRSLAQNLRSALSECWIVFVLALVFIPVAGSVRRTGAHSIGQIWLDRQAIAHDMAVYGLILAGTIVLLWLLRRALLFSRNFFQTGQGGIASYFSPDNKHYSGFERVFLILPLAYWSFTDFGLKPSDLLNPATIAMAIFCVAGAFPFKSSVLRSSVWAVGILLLAVGYLIYRD